MARSLSKYASERSKVRAQIAGNTRPRFTRRTRGGFRIDDYKRKLCQLPVVLCSLSVVLSQRTLGFCLSWCGFVNYTLA